MDKKRLENLSDEEIEALVEKLRCDVKQKKYEVDTINKELIDIQNSIRQQQDDRRVFTTKVVQVEEAAPLIEEGKRLHRELKEKQNYLSQLSKGGAKEQNEVKGLECRLHELTHSSCDELKSLEEENKENTEAIQGLETAYKEKQAVCQRAKDELSRLMDEVDKLSQRQIRSSTQSVVSQKSKHGGHSALSKKLDDLILKSSQEAGLKL